jgi:hypothetical protein
VEGRALNMAVDDPGGIGIISESQAGSIVRALRKVF